MHKGIRLCNGILVISSATDLIIYSLYEELNSSTFLYTLCTKHFRFSLATPTLCTRGLLGKQTSKKTLVLSFDTVGYSSILEPWPYNQTEKNNPPKQMKKESVKRTIVFPVGSTNHLPNTTQCYIRLDGKALESAEHADCTDLAQLSI